MKMEKHIDRTFWRLPLARVGFALLAQAALALVLAVAGVAAPWRHAAGWWVGWLVLVNVATVAMLALQQRRDGTSFAALFAAAPDRPRLELPWYVLALVVSAPLGLLPNIFLARALWGNIAGGIPLAFHAMPMGFVWALMVLVPLSQGLAEPPLYLGYLFARLVRGGTPRRRAILSCATAMSVQNLVFPALLDWRFALWRGLMFFPLSLWLAWLVARRPALLPYLSVAHGLMNASLVLLVMRLSLPLG